MRTPWLFIGFSLVCLTVVPCIAQEEAPEPEAEEQQVVDVSGVWEMTWQGPIEPQTGFLTFEQDGEKLSGKFDGPGGQSLELKGVLMGSNISFSLLFPPPREGTSLDYTGTVEGDLMTGTAELPRDTIEWSAKRK